MSPQANVQASVHARLLTGARQRGEDFNLTLQRYFAERFLYRLGESPHRKRFVLKGAMLLPLWGASLYRPTRDLDLTGYTKDDATDIAAVIRDICGIPCPDDGVTFATSSVRAEPIRDHAEYHGFRVKIGAMLGTVRSTLQIDVGLGDVVEPGAIELQYPVLLPMPAPHIRTYPRDAVIAEKLHAMVSLGAANSRFKDFHDVWVLANGFSFAGGVLCRSIAATFERRQTRIDGADPVALTSAFYADDKRTTEWQRYLSRNRLAAPPQDFSATGQLITGFLRPVWSAAASGELIEDVWAPGGPWGTAS